MRDKCGEERKLSVIISKTIFESELLVRKKELGFILDRPLSPSPLIFLK
jgi:hypothetical protein